MVKINVVNKHHGAKGEYIGRGSPLGNPYAIGPGVTRQEVIARYEQWLKDMIQGKNYQVLRQLDRLADIAMAGELNLVCFCAPQACHGDVLKRVLLEAIENQGNEKA